jgi:hypothetical protein
MDLEAFAQDNGLASCVDKVRIWRRELSSSNDGIVIRRNLRRDTQLESTARGRDTLRRFIGHVAVRTSVGAPWMKQLLEDRSEELLGQGRTVAMHASTDLLARATSLLGVANYLTHPRVTITDPRHLRRWASRFLTDPTRVRSVIGATLPVRGVLPIVFGCPDVDRQVKWPSGTAVPDINAVLGLPQVDPPIDLCVMRFRRSAIPCRGHVPTGLDAYNHPYYEPVLPGSMWGLTRDLRSSVSAPIQGVRECVVVAFPARHIEDFELVEA